MKFDIAISFAGPQRALARELAQKLQSRNLRVFFDELFEHEMLGADGADYLNNIFFKEARFCAALVSKDYDNAAWAQLERRAAQAQEMLQRQGILIPILVDDYRPPWLLPTRIYFNLFSRGMDDLVVTLTRKINSHPGDQYRVVAEIQDIYGDDSHLSVAYIGADKFALWSDRNHHRTIVTLTIRDSGVSRTLIDVDVSCEDITDIGYASGEGRGDGR